MLSNSLFALYDCSQIIGLCLYCQYKQIILVSQAFWGLMPSKITEFFHFLLYYFISLALLYRSHGCSFSSIMYHSHQAPVIQNNWALSLEWAVSIYLPLTSYIHNQFIVKTKVSSSYQATLRPGGPKSGYIRGSI